jgi:uncharacterized protein with FMN-binding domain
MKKAIGFLIFIIAAGVIMIVSMTIKMDQEIQNLEYYAVNLDELADGLYQGVAETTFVTVEVEVEVLDHKIIRIDLLKHDNALGQKAEAITADMILLNTYEVDAVSGATSSSQVIKSAVSDALANGRQ